MGQGLTGEAWYLTRRRDCGAASPGAANWGRGVAVSRAIENQNLRNGLRTISRIQQELNNDILVKFWNVFVILHEPCYTHFFLDRTESAKGTKTLVVA